MSNTPAAQPSRRRQPDPSAPPLPNGGGLTNTETHRIDAAVALQWFLGRTSPMSLPFGDSTPKVENILIGAVAEKFECPQLAIERAVAELRAVLLKESDGPTEKFYVHLHIVSYLQLLVQIVCLMADGSDAAMDDLGNALERVRQSRIICHQVLRASRAATAAQNAWRNERLTAAGYSPGR